MHRVKPGITRIRTYECIVLCGLSSGAGINVLFLCFHGTNHLFLTIINYGTWQRATCCRETKKTLDRIRSVCHSSGAFNYTLWVYSLWWCLCRPVCSSFCVHVVQSCGVRFHTFRYQILELRVLTSYTLSTKFKMCARRFKALICGISDLSAIFLHHILRRYELWRGHRWGVDISACHYHGRFAWRSRKRTIDRLACQEIRTFVRVQQQACYCPHSYCLWMTPRPRSPGRCEAEPTVLAKYILALLQHDK